MDRLQVSTMMTATVLFVKRYPCDEFAVKFDQSPAVIGLRDVKLFVSGETGSATMGHGLRSVSDIREGMKLVIHDAGVWNVKTTALHCAKVSLDNNRGGNNNDVGRNNCVEEDANGCVVDAVTHAKSSGVVPCRRKHITMSMM